MDCLDRTNVVQSVICKEFTQNVVSDWKHPSLNFFACFFPFLPVTEVRSRFPIHSSQWSVLEALSGAVGQ